MQLGGVTDPGPRPCSEMCGRLGRLLSSLTSDGPASLLPDGEAVTGTDLLGVLEEASGACDDATGQPAEECVVKSGHLPGPRHGCTCTEGTAQLHAGMALLTSFLSSQ